MEEQTKAFLDGFNEVVPLEWLRYFDEKELEVRSTRIRGLNFTCCRANTTMFIKRFHVFGVLLNSWTIFQLFNEKGDCKISQAQ